MNLAIEIRQSRIQLFPLLLRQGYLGAAGAVHPGINLVLDAVVIGRTEEQLTHRTANLLANVRLSKIIGELSQKRSHVTNRTSQHDINIVANTGMHDAAREDFLPHSSGNSTSRANCIDGPEMVLMSTSRKGKIRTHSQRGSIESAFHIVRGK